MSILKTLTKNRLANRFTEAKEPEPQESLRWNEPRTIAKLTTASRFLRHHEPDAGHGASVMSIPKARIKIRLVNRFTEAKEPNPQESLR